MMATQSLSSFVSPKFAFPARLPFLLAYPLFLMLGVFFRHIFVTISFFSTIVRYSFFSPAICLIYWREHVVLFVLSTLAWHLQCLISLLHLRCAIVSGRVETTELVSLYDESARTLEVLDVDG